MQHWSTQSFWAILIGAVTLAPIATAKAGEVMVPSVNSGFLSVHVTSLRERKFLSTIHQKYDYSCGSAAVATLLTYQFHDPVSEATVFKAMWDHGDKNKIRREGFSMLDMKNYLDARGYVANGYRAPLSKLKQAGLPAIALIAENGYAHFVVIKGIKGDRVLLGDPALGTRVVSRANFLKNWHIRILFVITNAKSHAVFNNPSDWAANPTAPLGVAVVPSNLLNVTLLLPRPLDF